MWILCIGWSYQYAAPTHDHNTGSFAAGFAEKGTVLGDCSSRMALMHWQTGNQQEVAI